MGVGLTGPTYSDPEIPHFAHRLPGGAMRNFASHPASIAVALLGDLEKVAVSRRRLVDGGAPTTSCVRSPRTTAHRP